MPTMLAGAGGDAIEVAGITATFDYEVLPVNPIDCSDKVSAREATGRP